LALLEAIVHVFTPHPYQGLGSIDNANSFVMAMPPPWHDGEPYALAFALGFSPIHKFISTTSILGKGCQQ
jgi:hypothetical protein